VSNLQFESFRLGFQKAGMAAAARKVIIASRLFQTKSVVVASPPSEIIGGALNGMGGLIEHYRYPQAGVLLFG
jgi:hypothetical protein